MKKKVLIGLLGPNLDMGTKNTRWEKWRPSVALCMHEDLAFDRYELLYQKRFHLLAETISSDILSVSPETTLRQHHIDWRDPWDFVEVYSALYDFACHYSFKEDEEYFINITTGTHVAQICLFLLTESYHFPAQLIQSSPSQKKHKNVAGTYSIIDLDLSKYDSLANRFQAETFESYDLLKSGIKTRDDKFNRLIEHIEKVCLRSDAPLLLRGPTGAGKSQLASRIYELRKQKHQLKGNFVEVNCATLRGDAAMSTLFGHKKGSYTGATSDRPGLLKEADGGLLFLDEIGELGLDEQAMLLRALEDKSFLPLGSDSSTTSDFQLICGTNRELYKASEEGLFREDLLARINIWDFELPGLKNRTADIAPNIDHELQKFAESSGKLMRFTKEARKSYLDFATSAEATWKSNFRDLNASIHRMTTLADSSRIGNDICDKEVQRLQRQWQSLEHPRDEVILNELFSPNFIESIDPFDRPQLAKVIQTCRESKNLSEAGRKLFCVSRKNKKVPNDADRLRKYLARFELSWKDIKV